MPQNVPPVATCGKPSGIDSPHPEKPVFEFSHARGSNEDKKKEGGIYIKSLVFS